jgi:hypothetical protein
MILAAALSIGIERKIVAPSLVNVTFLPSSLNDCKILSCTERNRVSADETQPLNALAKLSLRCIGMA